MCQRRGVEAWSCVPNAVTRRRHSRAESVGARRVGGVAPFADATRDAHNVAYGHGIWYMMPLTLTHDGTSPLTLTLNPHTGLLVSGSLDGDMRVWNLSSTAPESSCIAVLRPPQGGGEGECEGEGEGGGEGEGEGGSG